jgi:hypothetical protein
MAETASWRLGERSEYCIPGIPNLEFIFCRVRVPLGAGRDPVVTEISVVESNLCSTLSTGCYFNAETQASANLPIASPCGRGKAETLIALFDEIATLSRSAGLQRACR